MKIGRQMTLRNALLVFILALGACYASFVIASLPLLAREIKEPGFISTGYKNSVTVGALSDISPLDSWRQRQAKTLAKYPLSWDDAGKAIMAIQVGAIAYMLANHEIRKVKTKKDYLRL